MAQHAGDTAAEDQRHLLADGGSYAEPGETPAPHAHFHEHRLLLGLTYRHTHVHAHTPQHAHDHAAALPQRPGVACHPPRALVMLLVRVAMRVAAVALMVVVFWKAPVPWSSLIEKYVSFVRSFGPVGGPVAFAAAATLWCAVSPTGYAPAVVAGATFGPWVGPPVTIVAVNAGALLNVLWVRRARTLVAAAAARLPLALTTRVSAWLGRATIPYLGELVRLRPFTTVVLVRLPYLGNGAVNYVFSLSDVAVAPYAAGNLVGMTPGSVLFSTLGTQVGSLLRALFAPEGGKVTRDAIVMISCVAGATALSVIALAVIARRVLRSSVARYAAQRPDDDGAAAAAGAELVQPQPQPAGDQPKQETDADDVPHGGSEAQQHTQQAPG
eukprot:m51a1_g2311 hypothetical protein (384) ;mRNA; f:468528-469744